MSGGRYDYKNYLLGEIADDIEIVLNKSGKLKTKEELDPWKDDEWFNKYPEDRYHYNYSEEVKKEFRKSIEILRKAYIYAHEIDYLLSGDTGEESFLNRLKEKLLKLNENKFGS